MTSLADLLDDITLYAWTELAAGTADAHDARRALAHAATVLERLAVRLPAWPAATSAQRDRTLNDVIDRCRAVSTARDTDRPTEVRRSENSAFPLEASRRLSDLLAVTSDLVATMNPPMSPGERWALCGALLDPMCACVGLLRETDPSVAIVDLDSSLRQLRWWTKTRPANNGDAARLDQARPATPVYRGTGSPSLQELIDVIGYAIETKRVEPCDGRVATAAGLHIALYAKTVSSSIDGGTLDALTCDAMTRSWFRLRDLLRDVAGDAVRSELLPYVAELSHQLVIRFGPPEAPTAERGDAAENITAFRGLVNRLPTLAHGLARAAAQWGTRSESDLDSSMPIAWRDRTGVERYAGIAPTRVASIAALAIVEHAFHASHQSAVVAAQADRAATRIGRQPHPNLVKALIEEAQTTRPAELETGPQASWHAVVAGLDARACRDAAWPLLARTLDRAARAGWDVNAQLPGLARNLPARQPAVELTYRVLECCDLPATVCTDLGPPSGQTGASAGSHKPALAARSPESHAPAR